METASEPLQIAIKHHQAGRLREAEQLYRQILASNPRDAAALHLLGVVAHQAGRDDAAIELISKAIHIDGTQPDYHCNLGGAYRHAGRIGEARVCYERALELDPALGAAHYNLGLLLQTTGDWSEAQRHFEQSARLQPNHGETHNNLGNLLRAQANLPEAVAAYQRALGCRPDYVEALMGLGLARLGNGEWLEGWADHEDYLQLKFGSRPEFDGPRWDGSPLEGRTILVHACYAIGDVIHFVRYCPLIQERGGRVLVEVHGKLMPLLEQSGFRNLIAHGSPPPKFDVQISLLRLPSVFQTTLDTIPADIPYLAADPGRIEDWALRLAEWSGLKIGIHWQGNVDRPIDRYRSMKLDCFGPLADVPGVTLISLQKGGGCEQIGEVANRFAVHGLDGLDEDGEAFLDSAAVMKNLDLVITCDSALGHLAGALGVPVWLALATNSDWRWVRGRQDSPWYPTMRLFRQSRFGQWSDVFERMADELREMASRRSTP